MPNIVVNDITPRIQYNAAAGQTVFIFPFLMFYPTDINVYKRKLTDKPDDLIDILTYNINYTVTINPPPAVGGFITLFVPAAAGDVVTLVRNQPDQRLNYYIQGGPFTSAMVNFDFDQIVLMDQQRQMYDEVAGVHYDLNAIIEPNIDNYMDILPPGYGWMKNLDNTRIIAAPFGNGGGQVIIEIEVPGHGFTADQVVFYNGTTYQLALADNAIDAEVIGMVDSVVSADAFRLLVGGRAIMKTLTLTPGGVYFVSDVTPGLLTLTEPTAIGHVSKPILISDGATTGVFYNFRGKVINAESSFSPELVYVSNNGSDVTGDGTPVNPYLTYEHARVSVAPLATNINPYTIIMLGHFIIPGDMLLSPFVSVAGINQQTSILAISGQVLLDAAFATTANPQAQLQNIELDVFGDINLIFTTYQNATVHFDNVSFGSTSAFNATGAGSNINCELVLIENCISIVTQPAFTFTNIKGAIVNSNVITTTSINNSAVTQNFFILTAPIANVGNVTMQTTSTGTMLAVMQGCFNPGSTITIDGIGVSFLTDSASYGILPAFLNGATFGQVTLVSLSDGVAANNNFTPVNYIPTGTAAYKANSVTGNLKGIDDALAAIGGGVASVSGTVDQIASTGGANPVLSITNPFSVPGVMNVGTYTFNGPNIDSSGNMSLTPATGAVGIFGHVNIGGNGSIGDGSFLLQYNFTNTFYSAIRAPLALAQNINYEWPLTPPAANGYVLSSTIGGIWSWIAPASGTVTSVGLASSTGLQVSGSPVTGSGVINAELPASIGGRNLIINGAFQVWQRSNGASPALNIAASTTTYTADRWQLVTNANQGFSMSQQALTSGRYFGTVQRSNGQTGTGVVTLTTSLTRDMCAGVAGKIVTLSFIASKGPNYSPAASLLSVKIISGTGTTDTSVLSGWTSQATQATTNVTLTTGFQVFTLSTPLLSTSVTQLAVQFSMTPVGTAGVSDSFNVTEVQLEISPTATAYEYIPFQDTLRRCIFFYQKSTDYTIPPSNPSVGRSGHLLSVPVAAVAAGQFYARFDFPVSMRTAPTVITYPYTTPANTGRWSNGTGVDYGANSAQVAQVNTNSFIINNSSGAPITVSGNQAIFGGWVADAELI